jgi:hypothetical protein
MNKNIECQNRKINFIWGDMFTLIKKYEETKHYISELEIKIRNRINYSRLEHT